MDDVSSAAFHNLDTFTLDASGAGVLPLPLAEIVEIPEWQPRDGLSESTVRKYASTYESGGADMPPLLVARVVLGGQERLALLDGRHRAAALRSLGKASATCKVLGGVLDRQEAAWKAAAANLQHGLPLKAREVRKAFGAYIRARQHRIAGRQQRYHAKDRFKSYRQMQSDLGGGVSHSTIRAWMYKDFPGVAREIADASGGGDLAVAWVGYGGTGDDNQTGASASAEASIANEALEALVRAGEALRIVKEPGEKRRIAREVFALAEALEAEGYGAGEVAALEDAPDF